MLQPAYNLTFHIAFTCPLWQRKGSGREFAAFTVGGTYRAPHGSGKPGHYLQSNQQIMQAIARANEEAVVRLGNLLYHRALVRREQERITDPKGQPIGWLLDTRMAMLDSELFHRVGAYLADRLEGRNLHQVAGFGFGAYPMVCSVLAAADGRPFRGGFIREFPKPYGRHRLVEGPLDRSKPVVILDDILNSGRSAGKALALLQNDGFAVAGMVTLFNFAWSQGKRRLEGEGLWVEALVDLNLRGSPGTSMSSDSAG